MSPDDALELCTNTQADLSAELDTAAELHLERSADTIYGRQWRRWATDRLEAELDQLDDAGAAYDDVANELAARMIEDSRVAQATGNARGELPS